MIGACVRIEIFGMFWTNQVKFCRKVVSRMRVAGALVNTKGLQFECTSLE